MIERIFWIFAISASVYFSYFACRGQWLRFSTNPTVLSVEIDYRIWQYRYPAYTVCSDYVNETNIPTIVKETWAISTDHKEYNYFHEFVKNVAGMTYTNFHSMNTYINDSRLSNTDLLRIAYQMKSFDRLPETPKSVYNMIMTEFGLCYSMTKLCRFQKPANNYTCQEGDIANTSQELCTTMDACKTSVTPKGGVGNFNVYVYVHTEDDIMLGDSQSIQLKKLTQTEIYISQTIADKKVKRLQPRARKCRYNDEPASPYFDYYTKNLCVMNCRVNNAKKVCGCIPFIYNIKNELSCNITGIYCLARNYDQWYPRQIYCDCPDMCESITTSIGITNPERLNGTLDKTLLITVFTPKSRIKRSVLFSLSDLIVSFGGTASLFLGCSFISIIELFYFIGEYVFICIRNVIQ